MKTTSYIGIIAMNNKTWWYNITAD